MTGTCPPSRHESRSQRCDWCLASLGKLRRIAVELCFAAGRAEVVGLPVVLAHRRRAGGFHLHPTNNILFHDIPSIAGAARTVPYGGAIFVRTNAARNPITVITPDQLCASSKASGIMVSASMLRMAPAATAVVAATTSGERPLKSA